MEAAGVEIAASEARLEPFKLRQSVVGPPLLKFLVAEFARTFGTLAQGDLPAVEAPRDLRQFGDGKGPDFSTRRERGAGLRILAAACVTP